jgi:TatD family-associated radical SAM protein
VEEVKADIDRRDLSRYSEVVFCGYGEPSYRLKEAREIALYIKSKLPSLPIRINTNGHSDLIFGIDTAPLYAGAFDTVSISLNTPSPERYVEICRPIYKEKAFDSLLNFAKNVKDYVQKTMFSVVKETLSESELAECKHIAEECGVTLKVRTYIPPEKQSGDR